MATKSWRESTDLIKKCVFITQRIFHGFKGVRREHAGTILKILEYRGQIESLSILNNTKSFSAEHGLTGTRDISIGEVRESRWGHRKLSSAALDYLCQIGELCVAEKRGTQKYFDLTEHAILDGCSQTDEMTMEEFMDWYITRRIKSIGFVWDKNGGAWQGHFLSDQAVRKAVLERLVEKMPLIRFRLRVFPIVFMHAGSLSPVRPVTLVGIARFPEPLDNMMWDRTMPGEGEWNEPVQ